MEFVLHSEVTSKEQTVQSEEAQGCLRNITKERKESINEIRHFIFLNQGH